MKYLNKTWFVLIVSLLGAGFIIELTHTLTGDGDRPRNGVDPLFWLSFVVIFCGITAFVWYRNNYRK